MLKLAIKDQPGLEVDDIELKENMQLFATDAFELIYNINLNKEKEIFFVMGSDNFNKMPFWRNYDKIKKIYNYIIIDRDPKEVSSTQIREMIKSNDEKVMKYLPEEVYNYIIKNKLYNN